MCMYLYTIGMCSDINVKEHPIAGGGVAILDNTIDISMAIDTAGKGVTRLCAHVPLFTLCTYT